MILNINKEALEGLSLTDVANEFCREIASKLNIFGEISDIDIPHDDSSNTNFLTYISFVFSFPF